MRSKQRDRHDDLLTRLIRYPKDTGTSGISPMALYGIIAGMVVVMIAIPDWELLPVFLMFAMAIACAGQVVLDIRRHPHHRLFKL